MCIDDNVFTVLISSLFWCLKVIVAYNDHALHLYLSTNGWMMAMAMANEIDLKSRSFRSVSGCGLIVGFWGAAIAEV